MGLSRSVCCLMVFGFALCVFVPTVVAQECLELVGHLESSEYWSHMVATEGYVYAIEPCPHGDEGAFTIIDVRTPSAPVEVSSLEICADHDALVVSGDYAYVNRRYTAPYRGFWGVQVIDISDPSSPSEVDLIRGRGGISAVSDGYAYTVDPEAGMWVIDISDPASPIEVGFLAAPGGREFRGVDVVGQHAYATSTTLDSYPSPTTRQFLDVIDMSDPSAPHVVASIQVAEVYIPDSIWRASNSDVTVSGAYAFVSSRVELCDSPINPTCYDFGGLSIVDVSDPAAPGFVANPGWPPPQQFVVSGHLLFATFKWDWQVSLRVIDIHDPSNPTFLGPPYPLEWEWIEPQAICHCERNLYTIGGVWDYATGSYYSGLQVFDPSGCRRPYEPPPITPPEIE